MCHLSPTKLSPISVRLNTLSEFKNFIDKVEAQNSGAQISDAYSMMA